MATRYGDELRRGLELQALGNRIIRLLGKRSVHPVDARVGGFWKAPETADAARLAEIDYAIPEAEDLIAWTAFIRGYCGRSIGPASAFRVTTCITASSPARPRFCRPCRRRRRSLATIPRESLPMSKTLAAPLQFDLARR
jgi:hypothetical protein